MWRDIGMWIGAQVKRLLKLMLTGMVIGLAVWPVWYAAASVREGHLLSTEEFRAVVTPFMDALAGDKH